MLRKGGGRPPEYRTKAGVRVPSVTTIIGKWGDHEGLLVWANRLGREGKDHRDERDKAAGAGHVAHAMIEAHVHGEQCEPPSANDLNLADVKDGPTAEEQRAEILSKAKHAFEQYLEWRESTRLEIVATEVPLVSELHRYGGTIDAVARVNGKLSVVDWKSSNSVRSSYLVQVAGYRALWDEHHPFDEPICRVHLLRVGKDADVFAHHSWGGDTIDQAWEMFKHLRAAYDIDYALRKAAA